MPIPRPPPLAASCGSHLLWLLRSRRIGLSTSNSLSSRSAPRPPADTRQRLTMREQCSPATGPASSSTRRTQLEVPHDLSQLGWLTGPRSNPTGLDFLSPLDRHQRCQEVRTGTVQCRRAGRAYGLAPSPTLLPEIAGKYEPEINAPRKGLNGACGATRSRMIL